MQKRGNFQNSKTYLTLYTDTTCNRH